MDAQLVLDAQNRERQAVYLADPSFMNACAALEAQEGLPPQSLSMFAGHRVGPVNSYEDMFVRNPEQCLEVYRHDHPKPVDPKAAQIDAALARSREREAKQAAHEEYVAEYNAYTAACRDRKERIEAARVLCNQEIAEANRAYSVAVVQAAMARDDVTREARHIRDAVAGLPVPEAPVKRQ